MSVRACTDGLFLRIDYLINCENLKIMMDKLPSDWLTNGLIDFEYKKYVLLAYLKNIKREFESVNLYPSLAELIFHYNNLVKVQENKDLIYEKFPKTISKADFEKLKITYKMALENDDLMQELEDIIGYAMPKFQTAIEQGKEIYEFVEENLEFQPVGIVPMYQDIGYLLINEDRNRDLSIYKYQITVFERSTERYRGINMEFVARDFTDFSRSFEKVKIDLAKNDKHLPNPATYAVISKLSFPEEQTILPVAKRLLIRNISVA